MPSGPKTLLIEKAKHFLSCSQLANHDAGEGINRHEQHNGQLLPEQRGFLLDSLAEKGVCLSNRKL